MSAGRPAAGRPRRRAKRKVTLGLAALLAAVGVLLGVVLGYAARGGGGTPSLQTVEQTVPVVTITVPGGEAP